MILNILDNKDELIASIAEETKYKNKVINALQMIKSEYYTDDPIPQIHLDDLIYDDDNKLCILQIYTPFDKYKIKATARVCDNSNNKNIFDVYFISDKCKMAKYVYTTDMLDKMMCSISDHIMTENYKMVYIEGKVEDVLFICIVDLDK